MTVTDPFGQPAKVGGKSPTMSMLVGRLVILIPSNLEKNVPNTLQPGTFQDRMTADLVVLDGDPTFSGFNRSTGQAETLAMDEDGKPLAIPARFDGKFFSQTGMINACRNALDPSHPDKMVLGRLAQGTPKQPGHSAPFFLNAASDADKAVALAWWNAEQAKAAKVTSPFG